MGAHNFEIICAYTIFVYYIFVLSGTEQNGIIPPDNIKRISNRHYHLGTDGSHRSFMHTTDSEQGQVIRFFDRYRCSVV